MYAILKKELTSFFSSATGYVIIALFLLINGLSLWVFENNYNILRAGFADISPYFSIAPWIFLFLIPAITMKSFSEEMSSGTIEILKTKPLSDTEIVLGKFLGAFALVLIAMVPTLIYVYSVYQLGNPVGNIDLGTVLGSFIGLIFLAAAYTAIGVFSSSISKNQLFSFLVATSLCFIFFYGFEVIGSYNLVGEADFFVKKLGLFEHFKGIEKGVLDTHSLVFFSVITVFFLITTIIILSNRTKIVRKLAIVISAICIILVASSHFKKRFDLTKNQRYTISETSQNTLQRIKKDIFITIYLKGDFPAEFKRLQTETEQFLIELKSKNHHLHYKFVSPKGKEKELIKKGLSPSSLQIMEGKKFSEIVIFPWAVVKYGKKEQNISLLKETNASSQNEQLEKSIQNLEYAFTDAFYKVSSNKTKKIAIIRGNGELNDLYLFDFLTKLKDYYHLAPFTLDSVSKTPKKTLEKLTQFDGIIIAKPTQKFSEKEKYVLDQYICNGGKSLWLIDNVTISMDSIAANGEALAYPKDLGITDLLFSYGVRVKHNLITDPLAAKIPLASGNLGNNTQYQFFNWKYYPLITSDENHLINTNIEPILIRFGNSLDTLKNDLLKKTVLLKSSPLSKAVGTPKIISLKDIQNQPKSTTSSEENNIISVLIEGIFRSAYKNRIKPFDIDTFSNKVAAKMVVISDGDLIANPLKNGNPIPLNIDKWSGRHYGNKEFLLNTINYLLDDKGLIKIRSKKITIPFLNKQRAYQETTYWQFINVALPIILLSIFGAIYLFIRKKKYSRKL